MAFKFVLRPSMLAQSAAVRGAAIAVARKLFKGVRRVIRFGGGASWATEADALAAGAVIERTRDLDIAFTPTSAGSTTYTETPQMMIIDCTTGGGEHQRQWSVVPILPVEVTTPLTPKSTVTDPPVIQRFSAPNLDGVAYADTYLAGNHPDCTISVPSPVTSHFWAWQGSGTVTLHESMKYKYCFPMVDSADGTTGEAVKSGTLMYLGWAYGTTSVLAVVRVEYEMIYTTVGITTGWYTRKLSWKFEEFEYTYTSTSYPVPPRSAVVTATDITFTCFDVRTPAGSLGEAYSTLTVPRSYAASCTYSTVQDLFGPTDFGLGAGVTISLTESGGVNGVNDPSESVATGRCMLAVYTNDTQNMALALYVGSTRYLYLFPSGQCFTPPVSLHRYVAPLRLVDTASAVVCGEIACNQFSSPWDTGTVAAYAWNYVAGTMLTATYVDFTGSAIDLAEVYSAGPSRNVFQSGCVYQGGRYWVGNYLLRVPPDSYYSYSVLYKDATVLSAKTEGAHSISRAATLRTRSKWVASWNAAFAYEGPDCSYLFVAQTTACNLVGKGPVNAYFDVYTDPLSAPIWSNDSFTDPTFTSPINNVRPIATTSYVVELSDPANQTVRVRRVRDVTVTKAGVTYLIRRFVFFTDGYTVETLFYMVYSGGVLIAAKSGPPDSTEGYALGSLLYGFYEDPVGRDPSADVTLPPTTSPALV